MTLHVKHQVGTFDTGHGLIPSYRWDIPTQIFHKGPTGYCEVQEVYVKQNGAYCKVWPTPRETYMARVTTSANGFHFFGTSHYLTGETAEFTTKVGFLSTFPYPVPPSDQWNLFWRDPGHGQPDEIGTAVTPDQVCFDFEPRADPARTAKVARVGLTPTALPSLASGTWRVTGEVLAHVPAGVGITVLSTDVNPPNNNPDFFQPGVTTWEGGPLAEQKFTASQAWQHFSMQVSTTGGMVMTNKRVYLNVGVDGAVVGGVCVRNLHLDQVFAGLAGDVDHQGSVVFEYRVAGTTGAWTRLGETLVEERGAAVLQAPWPGPPANYEFRARFVPPAYTGPPDTPLLPSTAAPSTPVNVEAPGAGTVIYSAIGGVDRPAGGTFIGSHIVLHCTINTSIFAPNPPPGALVGNVQLQWKLQGEDDTRWTNYGAPRAVNAQTNNNFDIPLDIPKTMTGDLMLRFVFTSSLPAIAPSVSPASTVGIIAPVPGPAPSQLFSMTPTSVAFGWNSIPNVDGYGVFGLSDVYKDREQVLQRTTGGRSNNMQCGSNFYSSFWIRGYSTDRNGKRWYGPAGEAWAHHGGGMRWERNQFQYHNIFEVQPNNP